MFNSAITPCLYIPQSKHYEMCWAIVVNIVLLTISSKTYIPFMYVPITMQTVCIVLLSLIHTPKVVVSSVLGWIGLAAVGVPVFADMDVGMILLAGTTGGYIVSFPIAACFISYVASKRWVKSYFDLACTLFVASSIVYTLGVSWLSTFIGLKAAVFHGFLMCIPGGLFKTMVIVSFVRKYKLLNSVR